MAIKPIIFEDEEEIERICSHQQWQKVVLVEKDKKDPWELSYNGNIPDRIIKKKILPAILSVRYYNDKEVAAKCKCSEEFIRGLRTHKIRPYLTNGIDFAGCYKFSGRYNKTITDEEARMICEHLQAHPTDTYREMMVDLAPDVPNVTKYLLSEIKLRHIFTHISKTYIW